MYNKATRWELYDGKNPAAGIDPFARHSRDRFLQTDELPAFLTTVEAHPDEAVRDFVMLALLTGARRNNVLAMRRDEVNLAEGTWRMGQTKNGQPHRVPPVRRPSRSSSGAFVPGRASSRSRTGQGGPHDAPEAVLGGDP